mmetsp:Transcript_145115/g.253195  ORF Transcript_145115/g.253195 Transcript_145115/m.253195 type:complete len:218 (+) Transcript_145115:1225-1878(+)
MIDRLTASYSTRTDRLTASCSKRTAARLTANSKTAARLTASSKRTAHLTASSTRSRPASCSMRHQGLAPQALAAPPRFCQPICQRKMDQLHPAAQALARALAQAHSATTSIVEPRKPAELAELLAQAPAATKSTAALPVAVSVLVSARSAARRTVALAAAVMNSKPAAAALPTEAVRPVQVPQSHLSRAEQQRNHRLEPKKVAAPLAEAQPMEPPRT